ENPESEKVQRIAEQWMKKVHDMFGNNHVLKEKMWNVIRDHSGEVAFYPMDEKIVQFMERAVRIMYEQNGAGKFDCGGGDDHIVKTKSGRCSRPSLDDVYLSHTGCIFDIEEKKND